MFSETRIGDFVVLVEAESSQLERRIEEITIDAIRVAGRWFRKHDGCCVVSHFDGFIKHHEHRKKKCPY